MTKLHELIAECDAGEVINSLITYYPEEANNSFGYLGVIRKLKNMQPDRGCNYMIDVYKDSDEFVSEYFGVHGVKGNDGLSYAMGFDPWSQWLAAEITDGSFEYLSRIEVVAHCLFEMTFAGFHEEDIASKLETIVSDAEDMLEEENGDIDEPAGDNEWSG